MFDKARLEKIAGRHKQASVSNFLFGSSITDPTQRGVATDIALYSNPFSGVPAAVNDFSRNMYNGRYGNAVGSLLFGGLSFLPFVGSAAAKGAIGAGSAATKAVAATGTAAAKTAPWWQRGLHSAGQMTGLLPGTGWQGAGVLATERAVEDGLDHAVTKMTAPKLTQNAQNAVQQVRSSGRF